VVGLLSRPVRPSFTPHHSKLLTRYISTTQGWAHRQDSMYVYKVKQQWCRKCHSMGKCVMRGIAARTGNSGLQQHQQPVSCSQQTAQILWMRKRTIANRCVWGGEVVNAMDIHLTYLCQDHRRHGIIMTFMARQQVSTCSPATSGHLEAEPGTNLGVA
jgi:hypothetical protein